MTKRELQKILGQNALLWAIASVVSFVLPMIADSLTEGRSAFLRMHGHLGPLTMALWVTNSLLGKVAAGADQRLREDWERSC